MDGRWSIVTARETARMWNYLPRRIALPVDNVKRHHQSVSPPEAARRLVTAHASSQSVCASASRLSLLRMSGIKQPVSQVRLTNVAVVRLRVGGRRYELACYKNKLSDWREGVEKDIDEVLQSRHVFSNVSKGVLAPDDGLQRDFGTRDAEAVCRVILERGEMQVSEKERAAALQSLSRDVCALVSEMCINPVTRRPYPVRLIASGMRDCHFSLHPTRPAKSQALALIRQLSSVMPIQRASMRVRISCDQAAAKALMSALRPLLAAVEEESWGADGAQFRLTALLSPGAYRQVEELLAKQAGGSRATMDIIDLKADNDDELRDDADDDGDDQQTAADMARLRIQQQQQEASAAAAPPAPRPAAAARPSPASSSSASVIVKSRKAARRDAAVEEIRTVGERRNWEEEEERGGEGGEGGAEVEDSALVRQRQQQQASRLKKERKQRQQRKQRHEDGERDDSRTDEPTPTDSAEQSERVEGGAAETEAAELPAGAQKAGRSGRRRRKVKVDSREQVAEAEAAASEEPEAG
jgi:ribosome maturation protein SDO1